MRRDWRWWLCRWLDWHFDVLLVGFDGCSEVGHCRTCDSRLLGDSQGNWFRVGAFGRLKEKQR